MRAKHRDRWVKLAIALSALLVGVALGHWSGQSDPRTAKIVASAKGTAPNDHSLTSEASTPPPDPRNVEMPRKGTQHLKPDALAGILQERKSSDRLRDITSFVEGLSPGDFATALLATKKLPSGADRDLATRLLVARWAEVDPGGALAFAANHKDFDEITGDVFRQLATDDLSGALARAETMSDPNLRYQAMRGALSVMVLNDPAGAIKLASSLANSPHTEPLTQMLYRQWSETDPAAAAAAAVQDSSNEGWRSPLGQVVRSWADQDPQAALGFAMTISDPEAQARSVGDIVRRWSDQDAGSAANWINSMPAGGVRDAAAAALASSVASTDVATAVGWAQSIADADARTAALQRVSRRVIWQDPTNGTTTLQNAGVPPAILQNLPSRRRH